MFTWIKSRYSNYLLGMFAFMFIGLIAYNSYASVCFLPTCNDADLVDYNLESWANPTCTGDDCYKVTGDITPTCTTSCPSGKTCVFQDGCYKVTSTCTTFCAAVANHVECNTDENGCSFVARECLNDKYLSQSACSTENNGAECVSSGECYIVNPTPAAPCNANNGYYNDETECKRYISDGSKQYCTSENECWIINECPSGYSLNCTETISTVCNPHSTFTNCKVSSCNEANSYYITYKDCTNDTEMDCYQDTTTQCWLPSNCDLTNKEYLYERTCEEEHHAVCNLKNGCYEPYICLEKNREFSDQSTCEEEYQENYMGCEYKSSIGCYRPFCDPGDDLFFDHRSCDDTYHDSCILDTNYGCYKVFASEECDETKSLYSDERTCETEWQSTCKIVDGCYKPTRFYINYIGVDYDCRYVISNCDVGYNDGIGKDCDEKYGCYGQTFIYPKNSDDPDGEGDRCYDHQCSYNNHELGFTEGTYIIATSGYSGPGTFKSGGKKKVRVSYYEYIEIHDNLGNVYTLDPRNRYPDPVWISKKATFKYNLCGYTEFTYYNGEGEFTFEGGRIYYIYPREGNIISDCN